MSTEKRIIVIGAGIIGVSTGLALKQAGFDVRLIDRGDPSLKTSEGNAGAFAFSDIVPLATPGVIRAAPRWLLDPLGPLSIRPAYVFSIVPWLVCFWRASWNDRFPALMQAQAELMALSRSALERQASLQGGESLLRREGQLRLYDTEASFHDSASYWEACKEFGIAYDLLTSSEEISDIQPGLAEKFQYAGYTPDWMNIRDPKLWLEHLSSQLIERGGSIELKAAQTLDVNTEEVRVQCDGEALSADCVVVAAGAWSKALAQSVGDTFPLETERGYNTTFDAGDFDLRTHLTFADHGFVVSKIGSHLRVGGAVELGGLTAPPNFQRAQTLLSKAKDFLPNMVAHQGTEWMGFRPSMPDSLPVIGASPKSSRVIYAFGHGHLGLTQSAATAELVRDCLLGTQWSINPSPFSPKRFMA